MDREIKYTTIESITADINFKDGNHLCVLFDDKAFCAANILNNGSSRADISTTQFRKFYEKILELNEKASGLNSDKDIKDRVLPFIKMLKSKVQYSNTRRLCGENYMKLMNSSIDSLDCSKEGEDLKVQIQNFKYFLESIIGYMPKN